MLRHYGVSVERVDEAMPAQEFFAAAADAGIGTQTWKFGGQMLRVSAIEIEWPSGQKDRIANVPANQFLLVEEGKGIVSSNPARRRP